MSSGIIYLNVGGVKYSTTRSTLCKYPQSMLGVMFSQEMMDDDMPPAQLDQDGYYFIDRDGKIFEYILQFLRSAEISLPTDEKVYNLLKCEAYFYQIEPLIQMFTITNSGEEIKSIEMVIISYRLSSYDYKKHYCRKVNNNQFEIINTVSTPFKKKEYDQEELVDNHWQLIEQRVVSTNGQMSSFILLLDFNKTSFSSIFKDLQHMGVNVTVQVSYYVRK